MNNSTVIVSNLSIKEIRELRNNGGLKNIVDSFQMIGTIEEMASVFEGLDSSESLVSDDRAATASRLATESDHAHHGDLSDVPFTQKSVEEKQNEKEREFAKKHKSDFNLSTWEKIELVKISRMHPLDQQLLLEMSLQDVDWKMVKEMRNRE